LADLEVYPNKGRRGSLSETSGSGLPPSYDEDGRDSSAHTRHAELEDDYFGTIVTEVTVVTTRKRYRVGDA